MNQKKITFAQRLELNSKNYHPNDLFDIKAAGDFLAQMCESFGLYTLMTDRHGTILMVNGDFGDFKPDVVNKPGIKIKVKERTVCHIYANYEHVSDENKKTAEKLLDSYIKTLIGYSDRSYIASEQSVYIDELEEKLEREEYQIKHEQQNDPLTGVLNRTYFMSCAKELEEREVVPTAVLCININDWKFFDRNFGEEESDRLITIVADIIKEYAPENAIIGRIEGDIFNVLLPMTEENEARSYLYKIQNVCQEYEDEILAPSIAVGCAMKTNVEETYRELFSDAEYDMLEDKVELKKVDGYRERLEKGLNLK